jgi:hypothetical protein
MIESFGMFSEFGNCMVGEIVKGAKYKNLRWAEVNDPDVDYYDIDRDDPVLVRLVEELGDEVNTRYSELKIVEIPDGIEWTVCEYDGLEWVAEAHRTWS